MNTNVEEAYKAVDLFLNRLNTQGSDTAANIGERYSTSSSIAFDILFEEGLITSRKGYKDRLGIVNITELGLEVIKMGGYEEYRRLQSKNISEEQQALKIQRVKDVVDLELAKMTLRDFPITKKRATIAYWIAIGLAALELIKLAIDLAK